MTGSEVLGVTRRRDQTPGSNVRGSASGAAWLFALSRLRADRVLCVGMPPPATLRGLQRISDQVVVVAGRTARTALLLPRVRAELDPQRSVPLVVRAAGIGSREADLLVVSAAGARRHPRLVRELLAGHGGAAYLEGVRARDLAATDDLELRVTPVAGTARTAAPVDCIGMHAVLRDMGLEGTVSHRGPVAAAERAARRCLPVRRLRAGTRPAWLRGSGPGVPRYIDDVAAGAGVDLSGHAWAVAARGEYDSQKVLVLLGPAGPPGPAAATHVVKVTRGPQHNARLDNEADALRAVAGLELPDRAPRLWFHGSADGRTVLGQTLLPGRAIADVGTWTAEDPALLDALEWLAALGERSRRPAAPGAVRVALEELLGRWTSVYSPPRELETRLRRRVGVELDAVPTVVQHGDPAFWNLVRLPDGGTGFLDWESYEPRGLPLWDALHLVRSWAAHAAVRQGVRSPAEAAAAWAEPGPFRTRLLAVVDTAVVNGLPRSAVAPLVLGYLVHRSVKEAGQQRDVRLADSASAAVLQRLLEQPALLAAWEAA